MAIFKPQIAWGGTNPTKAVPVPKPALPRPTGTGGVLSQPVGGALAGGLNRPSTLAPERTFGGGGAVAPAPRPAGTGGPRPVAQFTGGQAPGAPQPGWTQAKASPYLQTRTPPWGRQRRLPPEGAPRPGQQTLAQAGKVGFAGWRTPPKPGEAATRPPVPDVFARGQRPKGQPNMNIHWGARPAPGPGMGLIGGRPRPQGTPAPAAPPPTAGPPPAQEMLAELVASGVPPEEAAEMLAEMADEQGGANQHAELLESILATLGERGRGRGLGQGTAQAPPMFFGGGGAGGASPWLQTRGTPWSAYTAGGGDDVLSRLLDLLREGGYA